MSNHFTITGRLGDDRLSEYRLWERVSIGAADDCWEWQGARQSGAWRYGRISFGGREWRTHRLAWEATHGANVPAGMVVRHTCDNPPCCNPNHLVLGTFADNTADMLERGRQGDTARHGEDNGAARLTTQDVRDMRQDRTRGLTYADLGRKYRISKGHAHRVVNHANWKQGSK